MTKRIYIRGQWWDQEVILASVPYTPRMTKAPIPTSESYESITMDLFRKMEVLSYHKGLE